MRGGRTGFMVLSGLMLGQAIASPLMQKRQLDMAVVSTSATTEYSTSTEYVTGWSGASSAIAAAESAAMEGTLYETWYTTLVLTTAGSATPSTETTHITSTTTVTQTVTYTPSTWVSSSVTTSISSSYSVQIISLTTTVFNKVVTIYNGGSSTTSPSSSTVTSSTLTASATDGSYSGRITWYYSNSTGACGTELTESMSIVALGASLYDENNINSNPNDNPLCGKTITAIYNGITVTATVADRCAGCSYNDLDFSPSLFEQFTELSVGVLYDVPWYFNN